MANSVDSTLTLPQPRIGPNVEIVDHTDDASGKAGWRPVLRSQNTLYEKKRGSVINDARPGSSTIDNGTYTCRYRFKTQGRTGIAAGTLTEDVRFYAAVTVTETSPGTGAATYTVTDVSSANTTTWNYSTDITATWIDLGQLSCADDAEYVEVTYALTTATNISTANTFAIGAWYQRDRSTLAYYAGLGYPTNGHMPWDTALYGPDKPLPSWMLYHSHKNIEKLWSYRTGQHVAIARPASPYALPGVFHAYVQPGVDSVEFHFYGNWISGASEALSSYIDINGTRALTCPGDVTAGTRWGTYTVSGLKSTVGRWHRFLVEVNLFDCTSLSIYSANAARF